MSNSISLLGGTWQNFIDFITGFLAIIPQFLYFIFTCCASLMDMMQYVVRKVAGLDVYYVEGVAVEGDIVSNFIAGILGIDKSPTYSALSTVFWSLVIFGCILLVLSTIFAIIKTHYNYKEGSSSPINIIISSVKTFFLMAIIPVCCIFGVYLSNILLQTLDQITSYGGGTTMSDVYKNSSVSYSDVFEKGTTKTGHDTYSSYDFFGARAYTNSTTFSGILFKISAKNANRVRYGSYTASQNSTMGTTDLLWTDFGIFTSQLESNEARKEDVANMIDYAFTNCLTLKDKSLNASILGKESATLTSSFAYLESAVWYLGLIDVNCFSKYNVGLVWYYYNLWIFNYFVGYAAIIICTAVLGSIFFGMVARLVNLLCLFMVYPTLVGIGPLDNNSAIGKWKGEFIKNVLMGYGAIVGLNISYLLLAEFENIYFFHSDVLNYLVSIIILIAILVVIKDIMKMISSFAGGEDASSFGKSVKDEAKKLATQGAEKAMKTANFALKVGAKFDPTLKAIYLAKQKLDKIKQQMKERKAESLNGLGVGELASLREDADRDRTDAAQERLDAEKEHQQSEKDTADFEEMLDRADGMSRSDAIDEARSFGVATGNDGANKEKSAENIYKRYKSAEEEEYNAIDSNPTLSDAEKNDKKAEAHERLRKEAIDDFRANNQHANKEAEKLINSAELEERAKQAQKKYDDAMKTSKKKGFGSFMADFTGSTIKLVGNIMGVSTAWKNLSENSGLIDEFKTFGQRVLAQEGDNISLKLITKKQKEAADKQKKEDHRRALSQMSNNSQIMKRRIDDMAAEILRWQTRKQNVARNIENMRMTRFPASNTKTVSEMKADARIDYNNKARELMDKGRISEAVALTRKLGQELNYIDELETDKLRRFCQQVAYEERVGPGTVAERRLRATQRIDSKIAELRHYGLTRAARMLSMRKGVAISSIR